ncbi:MAG TPA: DUF5674 family protein [bacterium]|nr:DUF5674 family protein [bacterium]
MEYTSLINIRPSQQNMGMEVQDMLIRQLIQDIIHELIVWDLE